MLTKLVACKVVCGVAAIEILLYPWSALARCRGRNVCTPRVAVNKGISIKASSMLAFMPICVILGWCFMINAAVREPK